MLKFRLSTLSFLFWVFLFLTVSHIAVCDTAPDVWEVLRQEFRMNHEVTSTEVQEQIRWLAAHPSYLHKVSRQSEPYIYHILRQVKKRNLPGELALIPMIESAYDPFAYSGAGAAGLWQLMPRTGNDLGLKQDWWFDGRRSIGPSTDAALNYLIYLNKFFNGNWILAIAAYDAGEGTIARAVKATTKPGRTVYFWSLPIPMETKVYVPRLLALAEIIKNPAHYHVNLPHIPYQPYFEEVNIGSQIDLNHAAKLAGISYKELIKLNPGFNRWTTAPYKPFKLLIPTKKVSQFNLNLSNVAEEDRVSWTKHQVHHGDSLSNIAHRYHTTVNLLKQVNQLTSNSVKPNQAILIPNTKNTPVLAKKDSSAPSPLVLPIAAARNHRIIHIVQPEDSYGSIGKTYGVTAKEIKTWNKISNTEGLHKGQQLVLWKRLNKAAPYIIRPGDSLSLIAKAHQTKVNRLLDLNPELSRNKPLRLGQRILIG